MWSVGRDGMRTNRVAPAIMDRVSGMDSIAAKCKRKSGSDCMLVRARKARVVSLAFGRGDERLEVEFGGVGHSSDPET